ncbi:MAG TPA: redox-sensing transcriptional repressor Rex [Firmicutes bacterium]|jgi:redox-sensing transcriptional repressor|nr:redox-sensing transcriptional repressor Rex [Bacillota bacterium]
MCDDLVIIPKATLGRLPLYLRVLNGLHHLNIQFVSSEEMAMKLGITSSQLRKDLSYFGGQGIRGTGYDVAYLLGKIKAILGVSQNWQMAIVGLGKLGTALARYPGLQQHGINVAALFDIDEAKIGWKVGELSICHLSELTEKKKELGLEIAALTVPAQAAQEVTDLIVEAGIQGIWNFAPVRLETPENVIVQYEDLVVGVLTLSHLLSRRLGKMR